MPTPSTPMTLIRWRDAAVGMPVIEAYGWLTVMFRHGGVGKVTLDGDRWTDGLLRYEPGAITHYALLSDIEQLGKGG